MDEELMNRFRRGSPNREPAPVRARTAPVPPRKPTLPTAPPPVVQAQAPVAPAEPQFVEQSTAPKPPKVRKKRSLKGKKPLIGAVATLVIVLVISGGVWYFFLKPKNAAEATKKDAATLSSTPTIPGIKFPLYYPNNLPSGYTFNEDTKVLKENVLYYSITDPKGSKYHVTLQYIPADFNFNAFNSKFLKPDQYTTNVGSVVAGQAGASLIASIQTNKNVWIIVNSDAKDSIPQLETITRSFEEAK